jgi:hypothetical protein
MYIGTLKWGNSTMMSIDSEDISLSARDLSEPVLYSLVKTKTMSVIIDRQFLI